VYEVLPNGKHQVSSRTAAAHRLLEVVSDMIVGVRFGRIELDFRDAARRDLTTLPIVLDAGTLG
jgi:hypothetical protein